MTRTTIAGSMMLGLVFAAGAEAQTIVSAEHPDQLVSIIQDLGFQAKLEKDNVGDPVIRSACDPVRAFDHNEVAVAREGAHDRRLRWVDPIQSASADPHPTRGPRRPGW